jgi:Protein of unknown function (DUF1360)
MGASGSPSSLDRVWWSVITFVVLCAAIARITRLVRDDTIFDGLRGRLYERLTRKDHGVGYWLFELLRCPWCISGWIAAGVVAITDAISSVPMPGFLWLAAWWGACFAYWTLELIAESHDEIWRKRDA